MPFYCYKTKDGDIIERFYSMGKAPSKIKVKGEWALRSIVSEWIGNQDVSSKNYPFECEASGVHPGDAQALGELLNKSGVPTEISKEGNPIYRNPSHRRKALAVRGMFDKNSYF